MPGVGTKRKKTLGKVLVEKGYITIKKLESIIHDQIEEIIFDLFIWEKGDFEYKDAKLNLQSMVVTKLNVVGVLLEASRRIDEMSILRKNGIKYLAFYFNSLFSFPIPTSTYLLP